MCPRLREFDPEEALDRAVDLFWEKGYEGTSMQDLVDHMGINRFSIYNTFGSKRRLFLLACQRYQEQVIEKMIGEMQARESGLEGIKQFFRQLEKSYVTGQLDRGCLMINTIAEKAYQDPEIRECTRVFLERLEDAFYQALRKAQQAGELKTITTLRYLAQFLVGVVNGISVVNKTYRDPGRVRHLIDIALGMLN